MRGRYVTAQVLLACSKKQKNIKKDIHGRIEETIAERKEMLPLWERSFLSGFFDLKMDVHEMLKETLAERELLILQWEKLFCAQEIIKYAEPVRDAA